MLLETQSPVVEELNSELALDWKVEDEVEAMVEMLFPLVESQYAPTAAKIIVITKSAALVAPMPMLLWAMFQEWHHSPGQIYIRWITICYAFGVLTW